MRRILLFAVLVLVSCKHSAPTPTPKAAEPKKLTFEGPLPAGVDGDAIDPSVDPCDDFYKYACGNWIKKTEIPADRSGWYRGFDTIAKRNEETLRDLLEGLAKGENKTTPYAEKLGTFWSTCMDEPALEKSEAALKAELKKIDTKNPAAVAATVGRLQLADIHPMFSIHSTQDARDATQVIGEIDQAGLGLPDRDYYLSDDKKMVEIRDAYVKHVQKIFELLKQYPESAQASAKNVMTVETLLAKAALDLVSRRDPEKLYHRINREGLKKEAPNFPWDVAFKEAGAKDVTALNVTHVPYVKALEELVKSTRPEVMKDYLTWKVVEASIPALPRAFQDEGFAFTSKTLTGAKEDRPRWKKCVSYTDAALGEALAIPYVEKTFGVEGKAQTQELVNEIEAAFEANLGTITWMDAATRAKALEKLKKFTNKIGFPDKWRNYDSMKIDKSSFLANWIHASEFETRRDLAKIGKPLDKTEWFISPPTVNAFYDPPKNEIVFPAGILQPPMFDRAATFPVNFGSIGMVVGHEVTHGFDDEGRQYDGDGNLKEWWTKESGEAFNTRTACVKKQYDDSIAIDTVHVNGALTMGENVADLGGLKLTHAAMQDWLKKNPGAVKPSRYNPDQQFFLGFAQVWCANIRPERARMLAQVDPHSPAALRVNNPLQNLKSFADAFGCHAGQKMVRAPACEVW